MSFFISRLFLNLQFTQFYEHDINYKFELSRCVLTKASSYNSRNNESHDMPSKFFFSFFVPFFRFYLKYPKKIAYDLLAFVFHFNKWQKNSAEKNCACCSDLNDFIDLCNLRRLSIIKYYQMVEFFVQLRFSHAAYDTHTSLLHVTT